MKNLVFALFVLCSVISYGQTQIQMPLPAQTGTFSGSVRGYWFVAPVCFTITGLEVPTDASSGYQNIAVLRFDSTPPTYSATTDDFDLLYLVQNSSTPGIIPVNIQVEQGDIIGLLGNRGDVNSYSINPVTSSINGVAIDITRLGMQFPLSSTVPTQLWTEDDNISRVFMYYDPYLHYQITKTHLGPYDVELKNGSDSTFVSVWNYGDGSPADTVWHATHTYSAQGLYNISSIITNTCGADTLHDTLMICGGIPNAAFSFMINEYSVTFSDSSLNAFSYEWDFGDGDTSMTQNPVHVFDSTGGTFVVCLIVNNFCGETDSICYTINISGAGLQDYTNGVEVGINPNPASTYTSFTVNFADNTQTYTLELLNLQGAVVGRYQGVAQQALKTDCSNLQAGMYMYRISNDKGMQAQGKFMVE